MALPIPNPRTYQASEFVTGAYMNAFRDAINFLVNRPGVVLYQATAQAMANATWTAVSLDSTLLDNYGSHSNSTNNSRFIAQQAGWHRAAGGVGFVQNATGAGRGAGFYKNGSPYTAGTSVVGNSGNIHVTSVSQDIYLAVGDYLELAGWQNSGGNLNSNGSGQYASWLAVRWEGN
jgi:hypothetical protein